MHPRNKCAVLNAMFHRLHVETSSTEVNATPLCEARYPLAWTTRSPGDGCANISTVRWELYWLSTMGGEAAQTDFLGG